jgi:O-antigen/teichoic acid export membrane protein
MKQLIQKLIREDNFLSLTGNALIAIFGIGGFAILARMLPMEIFGHWVLFIAGSSFVEMFRFGITGNGLIRFLSGATAEEKKELIASNALMGLLVSLFLVLVLIGCSNYLTSAISRSGFGLFFKYYPILIILNLPWNNAINVLQAQRFFGKILVIRALNSGLFFLFLIWGVIKGQLIVEEVVWAMIFINALTSTICIYYKWDGIYYVFHTTRKSLKTLLNFGKYTTFTLVGTNLLRNADTFIISLSPLGPAAVALYSIPLKLTELQQIPLRSFSATAFPKISKASISGDTKAVRKIFYTYSGALTILFFLGSLLTFIFADQLVFLLSGSSYSGTDSITGFNAADIVRVFSIYGLLLPIDRMTGIALDAINRPRVNALKVLIMVTLNIIGDLIAIFIFQSLIMLAIASILFTMAGIWLGMYFINKELKVTYNGIYKHGIKFYQNIWFRLQHLTKGERIIPTEKGLR